MLLQAGIKDGAKLNIAETTAFREHQAQAQAAQEQEALTQQQQAQAVQQVSMQTLEKQFAVSPHLGIQPDYLLCCALPAVLHLMTCACNILQEIREQHTMRLQVGVIASQVDQLAQQV